MGTARRRSAVVRHPRRPELERHPRLANPPRSADAGSGRLAPSTVSTVHDHELQTEAEAKVRRALDDLEERYAEEKSRLEDELRGASAAAEPVRYGLLYGTGAELVEAAALVLADAGFTTVYLDDLLGSSSSSDLLVTYEQPRRRPQATP